MLGSRTVTVEEFEREALPHLDGLYRTAVRLLGDRTKADDVVQDALLRAWKSFHQFEPGTNCRAWLFRIMMNSIHEHRRRWWNFVPLGAEEEALEQNLTYDPPLPEHLTDKEVLNALDQVPGDFRTVVLLADVEEFAYKEIAEMLSIPIGTVMSRLSRGRRLLRAQLAELAQSYGIRRAFQEGSAR